jgi:hypothetical protein
VYMVVGLVSVRKNTSRTLDFNFAIRGREAKKTTALAD